MSTMPRRLPRPAVLVCRRELTLLNLSYRLAIEPGTDVLDDVGILLAVILLGDVTEMRRQHDIVQLAEHVIARQRLDIKHIEPSAGNRLRLQRGDQGLLVDEGAARRIHE